MDFFSKCGKVEDYRRSANAEGKLNSWALLQFTEYEAAAKVRQRRR